MSADHKVIYLVTTGCRKSKDVDYFFNRLTKLGFRVYVFATETCTTIVNFSEERYSSIDIHTKKCSTDMHEIEKEDMILVVPCSFNTLEPV